MLFGAILPIVLFGLGMIGLAIYLHRNSPEKRAEREHKRIEKLWLERIKDKERCLNIAEFTEWVTIVEFLFNREGNLFRLTPEVAYWVKNNTQSSIEFFPTGLDTIRRTSLPIWFENPDEAFAFKMRWY